MKENFQVTSVEDGKKYWISRSVAVVGLLEVWVETPEDDACYVLAVKRGDGIDDEKNKWCIPCGYLDWSETIEDAVVREVYEETGIKTEKEDWRLMRVNSDPYSNRQNISFLYVYDSINTPIVIDDIQNYKFPKIDGNEVAEVKFIRLPWIKDANGQEDLDYSALDTYDWAFGHKNLIELYG
jgi:8-oxo-dGTP pyrophosphatase MutT (NUDIX family)